MSRGSIEFTGLPRMALTKAKQEEKNLKTIDLKNGERRTFMHDYRKLIYSSWYGCYGKQYKVSL